MKKLLLLIAFLPILFLSGCYDAKDIDNMAYTLALGVDLTENNDYLFTFQVVAPLNIKGGVETGLNVEGDGKPLINYKATGKDFFECFVKADDRISKELDLSQLKVIVFSQKALLNRYENLKEFFKNEKLFRDNIYICMVEGQAEKSLEHTSSPLELNPSKYYELVFSENSAERNISTPLWEFLKKDCFLIPVYKQTFEGLVPDGAYVLNGKEQPLYLTQNETYFYNVLSGKVRTTRYKNALLNLEKKPSCKTDYTNATLTYTVRIKCQKEKGSNLNIEKEFKNGLNNVLNKLKTNNSDALHIKESQKKYFLTFKDYEKNALDISKLDLKTNLVYHEINKEG